MRVNVVPRSGVRQAMPNGAQPLGTQSPRRAAVTLQAEGLLSLTP